MPHTIKFEKLKQSYLFILIPAVFAIFLSGVSLVMFVVNNNSTPNSYQEILINPIIAIGYLLGATSLLLLYFKPHNKIKIILGRVFAGILFAFSLLTILEFIYFIELGIVRAIYLLAEIMSPISEYALTIETSVIFLFLGISLLLNSYRPALNRIANILNTAVFLLALVAIVGYLFGVEGFYKFNNFSIFNIFSALCALSLAIAGFFTRPIGSYFSILMSKGSAGVFARRVSVACLLLPPFFGKLGLYFSNSGVPDSLTYAVVAILCLLAMVGVIWKSSTVLEIVDRNRLGSEQERNRSIAQIDAILGQAPIGIAFFGMDGNLIKANKIFNKYMFSEGTVASLKNLTLFQNNLQNLKDKNINELINQDLPGKTFEIQLNDEDKIIYLNTNFFAINSVTGEVMGLGCSFVEITHLKQIENELIMARDIANSSNKAKSQFLANMSHEIRTPIGVVMGFIDIIKNKSLSPGEWENHIAIIERNCRQLLNIIDDILDLSKVEAGKIKLQQEEVDTLVLIEDLKAILEFRSEEKQIQLEVLVQEPIPRTIISDNTRMRQVVLNICNNAIKFTKQGKVVVECFCQDKKLFFRITDQGCGIPSNQMDKLFKPFSQVDSSETREFGGNGLGLALSQKLARALGGDIIVERTEENVGSVFLVSFDTGVDLKNENILKRGRYQQMGTEAKKIELPDSKHKKVLVVDDSPDNRLLISHILKSEDINVETAKDGSEGYERAKNDEFDLVLLDLQMPVMGGYETAKKLREEGFDKPIVALTAHAMIGEKENCLNAGFDDYLTKPINKKKLLDVLKFNLQELAP